MVLTVANQKGGVGKSTTAHAIGAGLARRGKSVLFVDLDAQCNLTLSLGMEGRTPTAFELLTKRASIRDVIIETPEYDVIPASQFLASADVSMMETGKEYRLKEALSEARSFYDYIVIDTPPALGTLTVNALTASDKVLIPSQADVFSLQGIGQLANTLNSVKSYCNPALEILGIVLTRYSSRAVLSRDLATMITETAAQIGTHVYETAIREAIVIKEAQANHQSIFDYAPKSKAAADYDALLDEIFGEEAAANG